MLRSTVIVLAAAIVTGSGPCNTPTDTAPHKLIGMWGEPLYYPEDAWTEAETRLRVSIELGKGLSI